MSGLGIPKTASDLLKNFRAREVTKLMGHLRLYGPLPSVTPADGSAEPVQQLVLPNPFIPRKNPKSGKWREPRYSLRRQADIVKKAKETGDLGIVPPGPKFAAMELRMRRVQASLPASDWALLTAAQPKPATLDGTVARTEKTIKALEKSAETKRDDISLLQNQLSEREPQNDRDELAKFENEKVPEEDRQARVKRQREFATLKERIIEAQVKLNKADATLDSKQHELGLQKEDLAHSKLWREVVWSGDVKQKEKKGAELGIRLYAGKKKMFKGHLWEKQKIKRARKQTVLMRDMAKRVEKYKSVSLYLYFFVVCKADIRVLVLQKEETQSSQAFSLYQTSQASFLDSIRLPYHLMQYRCTLSFDIF